MPFLIISQVPSKLFDSMKLPNISSLMLITAIFQAYYQSENPITVCDNLGCLLKTVKSSRQNCYVVSVEK